MYKSRPTAHIWNDSTSSHESMTEFSLRLLAAVPRRLLRRCRDWEGVPLGLGRIFWKRLRNLDKKILDIVSILRRCFHVQNSILLRICVGILELHLPTRVEISLISGLQKDTIGEVGYKNSENKIRYVDVAQAIFYTRLTPRSHLPAQSRHWGHLSSAILSPKIWRQRTSRGW